MEEHPLQREFPLFQRLDAPAIVPPEILRTVHSYREAVRLCWQLRRVRNMKRSTLCELAGLYAAHVSDYFNPDDAQYRRDLPGDKVTAVEEALGNTAISQWLASQSQLTVLEEQLNFRRRAAA